MFPTPDYKPLTPGQAPSAANLNALNAWARKTSNAPGPDTDDSGGSQVPSGRKTTDAGGDGAAFLAIITAVSGSFSAGWAYTVQRIIGFNSGASRSDGAQWSTDGVSLAAINGMETYHGSFPFTHGVGVSITDSSGTVGSTSCVLKPLGLYAVVLCIQVIDTPAGVPVYVFSQANSAG